MKIKKQKKKTFHWPNISGLSKGPANLRNLFTRLITTLFKVFGLLAELTKIRLMTFAFV